MDRHWVTIRCHGTQWAQLRPVGPRLRQQLRTCHALLAPCHRTWAHPFWYTNKSALWKNGLKTTSYWREARILVGTPTLVLGRVSTQQRKASVEHDEFQSGNMLILALTCTEGPGLELDLAHSGYQRRRESSNKSPRIKCRVIHTAKKYQRKIELAYPLSLNISNNRPFKQPPAAQPFLQNIR